MRVLLNQLIAILALVSFLAAGAACVFFADGNRILSEVEAGVKSALVAVGTGIAILFFTILVLGVTGYIFKLKRDGKVQIVQDGKDGRVTRAVVIDQSQVVQIGSSEGFGLNELMQMQAQMTTQQQKMLQVVSAGATAMQRLASLEEYCAGGEEENLEIAGPKGEAIPSVVNYSSVADQVPADRSLLGIYPETGGLEIVDPERYKTAWFVGGSNMGKTNTVYGKVSDAVRWGARMIICDSHAHKKDSLANKLKDFHHTLLIPIAQTDEQIKDAIIKFLREFKARRDHGKSCAEKWLLVADEVNSTSNHMVRISKEEAAALLEEFGIKIEDEYVRLQVFFKFLAETCGYESRGFEMFGYFISQKVAGLSWLRNAMMTVFVHGLLMDSEALLAANNSRKMAEIVKAFKKGRTLIYGLDFDPIILHQPKYEEIGNGVVDSTTEMGTSEGTSSPASNEGKQASDDLVYFNPAQKRMEAEFDNFNSQAQKNGSSDETVESRIKRVILLMAKGSSVNFILKEEWGVSGGGGAYQGALNELREIQKTIARRALVG